MILLQLVCYEQIYLNSILELYQYSILKFYQNLDKPEPNLGWPLFQ